SNAATVFHGPQAGVGSMLLVTGGIAPPAVVGYNTDQLRAVTDKIRHETTEHRLIADCRHHPDAALAVKHGLFILVTKRTRSAPHIHHQTSQKTQVLLVGELLYPRYQLVFMVKLYPAVVFNLQGRVVEIVILAGVPELP